MKPAFNEGDKVWALMLDGTEVVGTYMYPGVHSLHKVRLESGAIQYLRPAELAVIALYKEP